jgi:hypothetical protein
MNKDLTVLYYTANVLREPAFSNIQKILLSAIGDIPLISVSQKPIDFGQNICVGPIGQSFLNIYKQMLTGAKAAKTKYVALAEDDALYSKEHFTTYVPKDDEFAYDMARWSLYTWTPDLYSIKFRISNSTMICPRDLLIEALEERFAKYPDESVIPLKFWGEFGKYERNLGVAVRKQLQYTSKVPSIVLSHEDAVGFGFLGKKKALGPLRAYDIPVWGKASDLIKKIYGTG